MTCWLAFFLIILLRLYGSTMFFLGFWWHFTVLHGAIPCGRFRWTTKKFHWSWHARALPFGVHQKRVLSFFFSAAYHESEPFKTKDDYITCALLLGHRYSWQFYDVFKYILYTSIYIYISIRMYIFFFFLRLALIILDNHIDPILTCHSRTGPFLRFMGVPARVFIDHWSKCQSVEMVLRFLRVHGVHIL